MNNRFKKILNIYKISNLNKDIIIKKDSNDWNNLYPIYKNIDRIKKNWSIYLRENNIRYTDDYNGFISWSIDKNKDIELKAEDLLDLIRDINKYVLNSKLGISSLERKHLKEKKKEPMRIFNMKDFNYNIWKEEIGKIESSGRYTATNRTTNALGKYQFLPRFWWENIKEFSKSKGIILSSYSDFLNNPDLQELFMEHYTNTNLMKTLSVIRRDQDTKYPKARELSDGKILALIHFQGPAGARKWLTTGEMIGAENNISVDKYLSRVS